jgi:transcriptional regulator EpsA
MTPPGPSERATAPVQRTSGARSKPAQLAPQAGESLVRLAETSSAVMRRSQFFVWSQGALSALLPHQVLCCGAYSRPQRGLGFMAFQSVVVSGTALAPLADANSELLRACVTAWVLGGGRPVQLETSHQPLPAQEQLVRLARELRGVKLLVHGVARPQRPAEIESLFVFLHTEPGAQTLDERLLHAEMVVPYLHTTWRRVVAAEAMLVPGGLDTTPSPGANGRVVTSAGALTDREREILRWAREGKSNLEIGAALDISALTVKNHIQKILRKLGASNRAHAVALAMSQGLL